MFSIAFFCNVCFRSGSYPSDMSSPVLSEAGHKKTGSFDSTSSPTVQTKPARPKPLVRET